MCSILKKGTAASEIVKSVTWIPAADSADFLRDWIYRRLSGNMNADGGRRRGCRAQDKNATRAFTRQSW